MRRRTQALIAVVIMAAIIVGAPVALSAPDVQTQDQQYTSNPAPKKKQKKRPPGCSKTYTAAMFHSAARKVYRRGGAIVSRGESKKIRHYLKCQRNPKMKSRLRRHLNGYKRAHTKRFYWEIEWSKVDPGLKNRLAGVRYCESTNNYRAVNGQYTGGYQYGADTWSRAGGSGQAMDASPREQDVRTAWFYPSHISEWDPRCRR